MSRILVIDDDAAIRRSLEIQLGREGHGVETADCVAEGLERLADPPEIVFLDLKLPDGTGLDVLRQLGDGGPAVIMISGAQDMMSTIEAIRLGAFDFIRKPLDRDDVLLAIEKASRHLASRADQGELVSVGELAERPRELVGRSRAVVELIKQVGMLSQSRVTVLIQGETGTGKELVARAIHDAGSPGRPFVALNCASIVDTLLESELFGHEQGAFTGAHARKIGRLELAGQGTLFLDEIGDMPLEAQASLLRALEERSFERVGGTEPIGLRARVLAATHHDLQARVTAGAFRQDLYYRLAVTQLDLPPLRERREDIPLLVRHLLGRIGQQVGRPVEAVTPEVLEQLSARDWPGNVRELENVLTRAVAESRSEVIDCLPDVPVGGGPAPEVTRDGAPLMSLREAERRHILKVLRELDWNITRSARALEISPTTLRKKITDYDLHRTG